MRHPSVFFAIACAASLALAAPSAPAGEPEKKQPPAKVELLLEEAQRRYQRGRELYEENDFTAALVEIRRAYTLAPSYKLLFDIGQICYQLQDYACALRSFTQYLREGGAEINPQRRSDVENDVRKLEGRVATLKVTTNQKGAEILVDDAVVGTAPLDAPVMVNPGKRKVTARITGAEPVSKIVEVAGTDVLDVALELGGAGKVAPGGSTPSSGAADPGTAKAGSERDAGKGGGVPVVPWIITGALAVGTGVTGALALGASGDYREKLDTLGTTRAELDDAHGKMRTMAIATDVLLGATAVAGATSLFLTLTAKPSAPKSAALSPVSVGVAPGNVTVRVTF